MKKPGKPKVTLTEEERMLVTLREELYGGSWDRMQTDLNSRLRGKPYIFKLATRIEQDLETIERLRKREQRHGVNFVDYLYEEEEI